jgi:hypothetical protein
VLLYFFASDGLVWTSSVNHTEHNTAPVVDTKVEALLGDDRDAFRALEIKLRRISASAFLVIVKNTACRISSMNLSKPRQFPNIF